MTAVWLQKLPLRPSCGFRESAVNHGYFYFLSVSRCSPPGRIQDIFTGPVLCAAMELCVLRRLGDLFPVEKWRKTRVKLQEGSERRSGRDERCGQPRAIFCVRGSGDWASRSASTVSGEGATRLLIRSLRLFSQRRCDHRFGAPGPPDLDFNRRTEFWPLHRGFHQTRQGPSLCYALTCRRSWQGSSLCYWTARSRGLLHNQYVFDNRSEPDRRWS